LRAMTGRSAQQLRDGWVGDLDNIAKLAERDALTLGELPTPTTPIPDAIRAAVEARLPT